MLGLVAVLLVIVGAVAGLAGSLVVEVFRTRRDHVRWLLDRQYEAYVPSLAYVNRLLDWAELEASTAADSTGPSGTDFDEFASRLALVASDDVQRAWRELDTSFRPFFGTHVHAVAARRAAQSSGSADSEDAIRLRLALVDTLTEARQRQANLAKAMAHDLKRAEEG